MMRRRTAQTALVAVGVAVLLGSYVVYAQRVVRELRLEAERSSRMLAVAYDGLFAPTDPERTAALIELIELIRESGVPLVVTRADGTPTATANLPFTDELDSPRVRAYIATLDAENTPVTEAILGTTVHFGSTPLVRGLRVIPTLQAASLALLFLAGVVLLRTHGRAERERMWAGMARESAHQLGTPLSSLHGWMEVLRDRAGDPLVESAIDHMRGDIERLERVAHRFERIGRPPRREAVDVHATIERVVDYFRARVPTLATPVRFVVPAHNDGLTVPGDKVLLEWVFESLIKNAVDALSGVGGVITVEAAALPGGRVRIRVADDGPGVPAALRARIFDAGFSTKEGGWGIGLALTRRIVQENHGGRLVLAPTEKGATFDVILPA
jgi:signal transduction histidine kinase